MEIFASTETEVACKDNNVQYGPFKAWFDQVWIKYHGL